MAKKKQIVSVDEKVVIAMLYLIRILLPVWAWLLLVLIVGGILSWLFDVLFN